MLRAFLERRLLYRSKRAKAADLACFKQQVIEIPCGAAHVAARFKQFGGDRLLLFSHGNSSSIESIAYLYSFYEELGYSYLAYDYPGYGNSPGTPSEQALYLSLRSVFSYATGTLGFAPEQIVLHGVSLGAAVSLGVLPELSARCAILQSAFTSLREIAKYRYNLPLYIFAPANSYPSIDRVSELKLPLLFVHGTADRSVPVEHGHRLRVAAGGPAFMLSVEGGSHSNLFGIAREDLLSSFRSFIENLSLSD